MPFELFSDVILTADLPDEDLKTGDVGTVVEHHVAPGIEEGYSVEFFDMTGKTVAVATISARMLRSPSHSDRPAVRLSPLLEKLLSLPHQFMLAA